MIGLWILKSGQEKWLLVIVKNREQNMDLYIDIEVFSDSFFLNTVVLVHSSQYRYNETGWGSEWQE